MEQSLQRSLPYGQAAFSFGRRLLSSCCSFSWTTLEELAVFSSLPQFPPPADDGVPIICDGESDNSPLVIEWLLLPGINQIQDDLDHVIFVAQCYHLFCCHQRQHNDTGILPAGQALIRCIFVVIWLVITLSSRACRFFLKSKFRKWRSVKI